MGKQKSITKASSVKVAKPLHFWQQLNFSKALIFLFAFFLFANSISNNYNLDDELVTINHRLTSKGISAIPEIFASPYYQDASGYSYGYRPVVLTSFAIEHQFFGDNAHISHFLNVILYALCCLLVLSVLQLLFVNYSPVIPLAITLLFAAHPSHTEVVCSIKNRDEILGLMFSLLTLYVTLKAIRTNRKWLLILSPFLFAIGLMSKITVIPFVLFVPIAMVLFTEARLGTVLLLTLLLEVPVYFLLMASLGFEKLLALAGILVVVIIFYSALNLKLVYASLKKQFIYFQNFVFVSIFSSTPKETDSQENKLKDILKGIIPGRSFLSLPPILLTASLAFLFVYGVASGYQYPAAIFIAFLFALAWKGSEKVAWWSVVMINLSLVAIFYNSKNYVFEDVGMGNYIYTSCVVQFLSYQLVFGKRSLFIPTLLAFISFHLVNIIKFNSWESLPAIVLVLLLMNRYLRYVFFTLNVVFFISALTGHDTIATKRIYLTEHLLAITMILSIHFNKWRKYLPLFIAGVAVICFYIYLSPVNQPISSAKVIVAKAIDVVNQNNPKIITNPQDRPLSFVEEVTSPTDPLSLRIGTSLEITFYYLQKVIVPYPLAFYYGFRFIRPMKITDTIPLISLVLHILLFLLALYFLNKNRYISFGLFIYLGSIAVFSNFLQPVPGMLADRFLLIPSLGWCILCIIIIDKLFKLNHSSKVFIWNSVPKNARYTFTGILVFYSLISFSRNFDWKDDITLFGHDIAYVNSSAQAHNLLAGRLMKHSFDSIPPSEQTEYRNRALSNFKTALEIYPEFYNAAFDIGRVYAIINIPDSAILYFKKAIAIDSTNSDAHLYIANLLVSNKRSNEAIPYLEYRIRHVPTDYSPYRTLSYIYFTLNEYQKSIDANRTAIKYLPTQADPYVNIGRTYLGMQNKDSARYYFQKADALMPGNQTLQQLIQETNKH